MRAVRQPQTEAKEEVTIDNNTLSHTTWNCKYHIVFAPKYRRQIIYGKVKADTGKILRELCDRKDIEILEATMFLLDVIGLSEDVIGDFFDFCISFLLVCAFYTEVKFDFWLCAGRTHCDPAIVGKFVEEDVGAWQSCGCAFTCCEVKALVGLDV